MRVFVIFLSINLLFACAAIPPVVTQPTNQFTPRPLQGPELYHHLVQQLAASLNENQVLTRLNAPLISTSFVWIHNYQQDSSAATFQYLGMSLEEAVSTALIKQQVKMKEYKVRPSISLDREGGYYLSRNKEAVSGKIEARYILVGTLSPLESGTTVNAKVINHQNGDVISSANVYFPYNSQYQRQVNMVNGSISREEG